MIKSVLTKDLQKKQILDEFLQHCEKSKSKPFITMIPIYFVLG